MNAMNILVCEDNVMTLKTIEFALKKAGYSVFKAVDGDQGIKVLAEEEIDLVITDINMPYTKGLELVRHINTHLETKIPVIVVTGITNKETKQHALELGAKGYITKPFDLNDMVALVRTVSGQN
jgi:DNA-binding response OmpR family regulator